MAETISLIPERIDTLNEAEAEAFVLPFAHDEMFLASQNLQDGYIYLRDKELNTEGFNLPDAYAQFIPAIAKCVSHERSVRGSRKIFECFVTIRQTTVQKDSSQQDDGPPLYLHRDSERPDFTGRFYGVCSTRPTWYFPDLAAKYPAFSAVRLADINIEDRTEFKPFDIVHASTQVQHCSPPMIEDTDRTFLRVSYTYLPEIIYKY